jgi:hypothetical protein
MLIAGAACGVTGLVGLTHAASPAVPSTPAQSAVVNVDDKNEPLEVQHLRAARKHLNEAKDAFEKDAVDTANHRKEILQGIDKAINAIDAEIDELMKK